MESFFASLSTVAIAEIGDKTQLLSLLLTLKFRNKLAIVAGILAATIVNHALSAAVGVWLAQFFQSSIGQSIIAVSFIALGAWLLIPDKDEESDGRFDRYGPFIATTVLFFIAEIGDKTQIATVLLGTQYQSLVWVTLGTTLGMLLANVPVVMYGEKLMQRIPFAAVHKLAAALFIAIGLYWLLF